MAPNNLRKRLPDWTAESTADLIKKFKDAAQEEKELMFEGLLASLKDNSPDEETSDEVVKGAKKPGHVVFLTAVGVLERLQRIVGAAWWNADIIYNGNNDDFKAFQRFENWKSNTAGHYSRYHLDYVRVGKKLEGFLGNKQAMKKHCDAFDVRFGGATAKAKSKKIDMFFTMCKNVYLAVETFGYGILASDKLLQGVGGSLWMRMSNPERELAQNKIHKMGEFEDGIPTAKYNGPIKDLVEKHFAQD
ncbi:hypothetical protein DFJ77DRAFT_441576 [Powellomyces hirtus]|nr:hypothetical protein DFJ77DRAFT_441576 [Powellomyces hirtus]